MPLFVIGSLRVYFAHCPKAGGSSLESFLTAHSESIKLLDRGWNKEWRQKGISRVDGSSSPQHLSWEEASARIGARPDVMFTVVRDPVERIISEYRYQRAKRHLYPHLRFGSFSSWLEIVLAASRNAPNLCDNHIRPQVDFVPDANIEVFNLEDGFDHVLAYLSRTVGTPRNGTIPHELKSTKVARPLIARQDAQLIHEYYQADYRRFGYSPPDLGTLPNDRKRGARKIAAKFLARPIAALYQAGRL